jgi:phosphoribosylformylglycinamidine synthase
MWQFAEAVRGVADACLELGVPVTGGNVSLYNGTGAPGQIDSSINPTAIIGMLGIFDDVRRATPSGWREAGQALYLLGNTGDDFGGSAYAARLGDLTGLPPAVDMAAEKILAEVMVSASRDGLADAAREVTEGGLAAAVVMGALRYGVGARIVLDEVVARDGVTPAQAWLSESQGRVLVAVPRTEEPRWADMLTARGVPFARIGVTQEDPTIEVQGQFTMPLATLRDNWEAPLPARFA